MTTSEDMRYVTVTKPGGPEAMQIIRGRIPQIKTGEVLIKVLAAGVNRPDILQRKGAYPPPPDASPVLGLEVAGQVVAISHDVTTLKEGDYVCALANGGGYAEYCAVPATQCLPWPDGFDAIQAAALPENYFTVWANVFMQGQLSKNQSLLVHGGSSGIGITAIQLAREFAGDVYATAGSQEKCQACCSLGALACINYHEEDFSQRILNLTANRGVDMVLDMVGAAYFSRNLDCLAMDGCLVEIATQQGAIVEKFDLRQLMKKRLWITGSTLRPRSLTEKSEIAMSLYKTVWPVLNQGRCKPIIAKVFPFTEVIQAHELMESSQHIGKIVLDLTLS